MNKKQIIASLNKIANELDSASLFVEALFVEANTVTKVMTKLAEDGDWRNSLLTDDQRAFLKKQDSLYSFLENRDSSLTNEQKSVVQKGKDMESIFSMFEPYAREILNKVGSKFIVRGQALQYFSATDTERAQMMSHFERKSQEDFHYGEDLNKYIFEFLKMAQGFQDEHDVPDAEMRTFIEALRPQP